MAAEESIVQERRAAPNLESSGQEGSHSFRSHQILNCALAFNYWIENAK